jgi:hypothetical protein
MMPPNTLEYLRIFSALPWFAEKVSDDLMPFSL